MIEVIYSPVCEKLPLIRAAAERYGFALKEINQWDINEQILGELPPYIQEVVLKFWNGEDGFYAWKIFQDGRDITLEFEKTYSLDFYSYPDLTWNGDMPVIDHRTIAVLPLSLDVLDRGLKGPGVFCLGPLAKDRDLNEIQRMRRAMYEEVSARLGSFGLALELDGLILGFTLFMPKDDARRAGYYSSRDDEMMGQTLVVSCIYIPGELRGEGLAGRLVAELKKLAPEWGYQRIEVAATHRYFDNEYTWWSKEPFIKAGFEHVEDRDYADGYPTMAIWRWGL